MSYMISIVVCDTKDRTVYRTVAMTISAEDSTHMVIMLV